MLALISSMISLCRNKIILGTIFITAASLIHYQYMFFASIYFVSAYMLSVFDWQDKNIKAIWRIPKSVDISINKRYHKLIWSSIGLVAFPFHQLRKYLATSLIGLSPNEINGSSALSRIGLDGNIHSGGLLGSLQFLGGYKWYYCFSIHSEVNKFISSLDNRTISAIVNCELILITMAIFSVISIYGVFTIYNLKKNNIKITNLWVINVLVFSYSAMLLIFQQSFTVHIVGYSYVWAFIFALGFSIAIYKNFILRELPWKIVGLIIYISCANSLIQASLKVTEIRHISTFF